MCRIAIGYFNIWSNLLIFDKNIKANFMISLKYSTNIEALLREQHLTPLDAGTPDSSVIEQLDNAFLERLFGKEIITNKTSARLCVAGLWLLHNHLEECHKIAQSIKTSDGSYWHAIMHRREGDFLNSKYWFRRVSEHEIFPELLKKAKKVVTQGDPESQINVLVTQSQWDPLTFVDLCEAAKHGKANAEFCQSIQQIEWKLLFDYCYKKTVST